MGKSKDLLNAKEETSDLNLDRNKDELDEKNSETEDRLPIITFRSVLVGIIISAFGATCAQIFIFKPIVLHVHSLFIQLACLTTGKLMARIPGPKRWNNGPFNIKETTFSSIMACSASAGAITSVEMIGARSLLFNENPEFFVSLLVMLSSQLIGYGLSGLLRPILVYPSKMIFPSVLPSVVLFKSMYSKSPESRKQISFFKKALLGIGLYEVFPIYMAPALQAVSPWCLTLPKKSEITQLFGGSMVGEGLGFLSLSLDWTIIGAHGPLYTPLDAQWNLLVAHIGAIFLFSAAYKYNWLGGGTLPFISFELLDHNGNSYDTAAIINFDGTEKTEAVNRLGLPFFSTAYIIGKACMCLATAAAFTAAILQNWRTIKDLITRKEIETDPHRLTCKKFRDFPMWAFVVLLIVSIALAFIASYVNKSGLSAWGLTSAILISALLSLASGFFYGSTGIRLHTSPVVQMLGGLLFPGNAVGTMWFTTFGSSTASQSTLMLKELKLGQYMHLSSFSIVVGQLIGTVIGVLINFVVFLSILSSEREALLKPEGNSAFSGMHLTSFEAQSITWGIFGKRLYGSGKRYAFVPYSLVAGFLLPIPFYFLQKYYPKMILSKVNVALIAGTFYVSIQGLTSGATMKLLIGFMSQFYMKKYHKSWYDKYNYILSAALDGGTQMAILICTFLFQGGAGLTVLFPHYFLNPSQVPRDYCLNNSG
ncbi:hypothetical protein PGT21_013608 [Puccinia graminis f. sp. tritici]|uniref:Oligopeptide transporter n=1 Tax=Puccinia graminis f. sp. tritici TaxID=56615 RepID=A0A5B0LX08_PUCGR|nr:hypothetical protein PGT21_013608 [Puccinia graminis f. sp. tritici]KAA1068218.1 hypothetical protein PGTUg99_027793 [Puccinia graminis f. sp. tritici]